MSNDYERWLFETLGESDQGLWRQWMKKTPCAQCPAGHLNKCCTYEPWLPNFLIGAALAKGLIDFSQVNEEESYVWTPLGRLPRLEMLLWHKEGGRLGDSGGPTCTFFIRGRCGLWPFHGSRCRSYFCRGDSLKFSQAQDNPDFFNLPDPHLDRIYEIWHQKESKGAFEALSRWALGSSVIKAQEQMWGEYFSLSSRQAFQDWKQTWYPPQWHTWGWPNQKSWWKEAPEFYRFCYKEILWQAS